MILKLSFVITFLYVTICIATSEDKKAEKIEGEPFSVVDVYIKSGGSCDCQPDWLEPVQKYYEDVYAAFNAFPSQVSEEATLVISTFQKILTKVVEFSTSKSKILSSGATAILESFAQVRLDNHKASDVIDEFTRVLSILMNAYRQLITNMTKIIGQDFVCAVNTALTDLEYEFKHYVKEFEKGDGNGKKVEVDYEPVMKRVQKLVNIIALKGDVKICESQLDEPNVQDALVVLNLVLDYLMVLVHGLSSSSEAVILEQKSESVILRVIVVAVGTFVSDVTESLVLNTSPNAVNVQKHMENLANCSTKLSETLSGLFDSVGRTTEQIKE